MVFAGGAGLYGFIIDSLNATYNPILINAGDGGTRGIFIDQGVLKYHDPISGGFYGMSLIRDPFLIHVSYSRVQINLVGLLMQSL